MKPIHEIIEQKAGQSFSCKERMQPAFDIGWHFHPELQMSLIISGQGYRIVGDNITPLQSGDLVLVGSNLPHLWHHDTLLEPPQRQNVHFITITFLENVFGEDFLRLPEMHAIRNLFLRARQGLHIFGKTRDRIASLMHGIASDQGGGLRRVICLLDALDILCHSSECESVASSGFMPELNLVDEQRVSQVCSYIIHHLDEEIHRDTLARLVHLTPVSFSRYFKGRTGKTLPDFINELRIGRACRMLAEKDLAITDIALTCGFTNLAHFHRQFQKRIRMTPRDYRKLLNEGQS